MVCEEEELSGGGQLQDCNIYSMMEGKEDDVEESKHGFESHRRLTKLFARKDLLSEFYPFFQVKLAENALTLLETQLSSFPFCSTNESRLIEVCFKSKAWLMSLNVVDVTLSHISM